MFKRYTVAQLQSEIPEVSELCELHFLWLLFPPSLPFIFLFSVSSAFLQFYKIIVFLLLLDSSIAFPCILFLFATQLTNFSPFIVQLVKVLDRFVPRSGEAKKHHRRRRDLCGIAWLPRQNYRFVEQFTPSKEVS